MSGVWTIITAFIGIGLLASGSSGWLLKRSNPIERVITIIGALGFVLPWHVGSVVGVAALGSVVVMQKMRA